MTINEVGSITFWLVNPNPYWMVDNKQYDFPPFMVRGMQVAAKKLVDKNILIAISGPLEMSHFFVGELSQVLDPMRVFVAVTWNNSVISLYLNTNLVHKIAIRRVERVPLSLRISTPDDSPSQELVDEVLKFLRRVLNSISGFLDAPDAQACQFVLEQGLDESKFSLASQGKGSWKGVLNCTKSVFDFIKEHFVTFFATCSGYADRLALAHVIEKESDATIKQEKARQEKLETMSKAAEVASSISTILYQCRSDMPDSHKALLLENHFLKPMLQLANTIVNNESSVEITTTDRKNAGSDVASDKSDKQ